MSALRGPAAALLCGFALIACSDPGAPAPAAASAAHDNNAAPLFYRNPMDPTVTSPTPAKDAMGMDYVPVYAADTQPGTFELPGPVVQKLALRTSPAVLEASARELAMPGIVRLDERTIQDLYVPAAGQVEKLAVRSVGESVQAGRLVFELYSPTLALVDTQYLQAVETGADPLAGPNALALRAMGLSDNLIADLRAKRRSPGRIPFHASRNMVVTALHVREGASVAQGTSVMQLAALDPVWAVFSMHEPVEAESLVGAAVSIRTPAQPGREFQAKLDYVLPELAAGTRAVQVRATLPNPDRMLLPGMYLSGTTTLAASAPMIHVPREAVVRGQDQDHVILALGEGRFAYRRVVVAHEYGDRIAVAEGLAAGERVVTNPLFLIDSEASIRSAEHRLGIGPDEPGAAQNSTAQPADRR